MKMIIYDDASVRCDLLPMSYTRPVGALRIGIDTIADKWQALLPGEYMWSPAADYLTEIFHLFPKSVFKFYVRTAAPFLRGGVLRFGGRAVRLRLVRGGASARRTGRRSISPARNGGCAGRIRRAPGRNPPP